MILKENKIRVEFPLLQQHQINLLNKILKFHLFNQSQAKKQIPYNKIVFQKDQLLKVHLKFQKFG